MKLLKSNFFYGSFAFVFGASIPLVFLNDLTDYLVLKHKYYTPHKEFSELKKMNRSKGNMSNSYSFYQLKSYIFTVLNGLPTVFVYPLLKNDLRIQYLINYKIDAINKNIKLFNNLDSEINLLISRDASIKLKHKIITEDDEKEIYNTNLVRVKEFLSKINRENLTESELFYLNQPISQTKDELIESLNKNRPLNKTEKIFLIDNKLSEYENKSIREFFTVNGTIISPGKHIPSTNLLTTIEDSTEYQERKLEMLNQSQDKRQRKLGASEKIEKIVDALNN